MIIGNKFNNDNSDYVYLKIMLGQSNCSSRAEATRLANTSYNYVGISTGYPSVRSGQPQYTTGANSNMYIYFKDQSNSANTKALDNGTYQLYNPGINSSTDSTQFQFCSFLSYGNKIKTLTGKNVYLIKAGWGATSLSDTITTASPGCWSSTNVQIANLYYIERGIRDLKILEPNKKIVLLPIFWSQGETDALNGISKATYKTLWLGLKNYVEKCIRQSLSINTPNSIIRWNFLLPNHYQNANETIIRTALIELASENIGCQTINWDSYPQKDQLSVGQASPLTLGTPINSLGGDDDNHASYIAQLAIGELDAQIAIDNNYL